MPSFITPSLLLRAGLAFAFTYAASGAFLEPNSWIGFYPPFLTENISDALLLTSFGVGELALAVWLLSGWYVRLAGGIAALALLGITVFNLPQMDIVFRDAALAAAALALAYLPR